jgi:hypothetical protein
MLRIEHLGLLPEAGIDDLRALCTAAWNDCGAAKLRIETSDGPRWQMPLHAKSVADFHAAIMAALSDVGIEVHIDEIPNELPAPIRFSEDRVHAAYDAEYAQRFWRVLLQADRVFKAFRTSFIGKCSPVHFFWGSFDLAVTRFSGRCAPRHPGGVPNLRTMLPARPIRMR